ncbi:hypothetical protein RJT34_24779 [Clitoria ternatea]|uniref:non-specific serine/threonine protein kinase n=1 Tax=Clitoria ternatea TaxID=43366 RepID=A0AAN9FNI2_CLITE
MQKQGFASKCVLPYQTPRFKDQYVIGEKLGKGSLGTTYLCTHKETGKLYASKSIPKWKLGCQEDYDDVWREIQIMHHLSEHPNVVQIKGAYEDSDSVDLVMELCAGGELFDRIIKKGHYSEKEAAKLIKTIVGVVEAYHSLGVIHRDLKPENFLFDTPDEDANIKATDFGLSVFFKPGQVFHEILGSSYYIAPEMLRKKYGPEVDVWSVGVMLYILLSGVPPFWADNSGTITFEELKQGLRSVGSNLMESEIKSLMDAADMNCNGTIDYGEFLAATLHMNKMEREENLVAAFSYFDKDGSGYITIDELQQACKDFGLGEVHLDGMIEEIDQDNDGKIDYAEFATMMKKKGKREKETQKHGFGSNSVLPYKTRRLKDHYLLGKKLGKGHSGTTYECTQKDTGKLYACKSIIKSKLLCQADYDDVWRELQIMHHLSEHPNVVHVRGAYEDSAFVHLVMELCAGGELFDRIIQKGHYSEREAAKLIKTIVGVVEACHSLGVMHRDLKPENFLFDTPDEDAKLKVTDFGFSLFFKPGQAFQDIVGTRYYIAPEMLRRKYGPEVDVIAERLSEEEIGGLKELFKMIDADNNGTITFEELREGLKSVGSNLMESEIKSLMDAADIDCNGTIDYGEFLAATLHLNKMEREENLVAAFAYFDKDGSGYITIDELQQAYKDFGLGEVPLEGMIQEIDQDNDGRIDYGEFVAMMKKGDADAVGRSVAMKGNLNFNHADAFGVGVED